MADGIRCGELCDIVNKGESVKSETLIIYAQLCILYIYVRILFPYCRNSMLMHTDTQLLAHYLDSACVYLECTPRAHYVVTVYIKF